jgi:hypothetical protein
MEMGAWGVQEEIKGNERATGVLRCHFFRCRLDMGFMREGLGSLEVDRCHPDFWRAGGMWWEGCENVEM